LTRRSGSGVPSFGSIDVGFAAGVVGFAAGVVGFAAGVVGFAAGIVGFAAGIVGFAAGIVGELTAAFEIAEVATRRVRAGLGASARSSTSCASTALATFVASR